MKIDKFTKVKNKIKFLPYPTFNKQSAEQQKIELINLKYNLTHVYVANY